MIPPGRAGLAPLLGLLAFAEESSGQGCVPTASPLQAAIDAAQPGDVILLPQAGSNLNASVCVTKPLTFVGTATTGLVTVQALSSVSAMTPRGVFTVTPNVSGVVTFQNLRIVGTDSYTNPAALMKGIYSESANAAIVVDGCEVRGANFLVGGAGESFAHGAPGIGGSLSRLLVSDSFVLGGNGAICFQQPFGCWFPNPCWAGDGGHAIDVSGEVVLVGSYLVGGAGGSVYHPCCNFPPSTLGAGGTGGSAVLAPAVWSWGSGGAGGLGGLKYCQNNFLDQAPSGSDLPSGSDSTLFTGPHPSPGGTATLTLQNPFGQFGVIAASLSGWAPTTVFPGHGPYFLGPNILGLAAGSALSGLSVAVPNDPSLVGFAIPIQAALGTSLASFEFTNPGLVLIQP